MMANHGISFLGDLNSNLFICLWRFRNNLGSLLKAEGLTDYNLEITSSFDYIFYFVPSEHMV